MFRILRMRFFIILEVFILSILISFSLFAQEKKAILPFYPTDNSNLAIESKIKSLKDVVKKERYFSALIAYKAVRQNGLSICNQAGDSIDCRAIAENLFGIRGFAEKNCDKIKERDLCNLCTQLKANNCSALSNWEKDMCEGFLKEDINLLEKALSSPDFIRVHGKGEKADIIETMALFMGFKHYNSKMACEKFASQLSMPKKFICEVIFATNDVDEILDKIASDISLFTLAKQYKNPKICEEIKHDDIKKSCLDSKVNSLHDIW